MARPEKIILFGSAASEGFGPDSDIDLLLIGEDLDPTPRGRAVLRAALRGLAYPADKYGKVIYEAA